MKDTTVRALLNIKYVGYVSQMHTCHMADVRKYGPDCPDAFIPQTFDQWKQSAVEVEHHRDNGFFVTILGERIVGRSFASYQAAEVYRQELI